MRRLLTIGLFFFAVLLMSGCMALGGGTSSYDPEINYSDIDVWNTTTDSTYFVRSNEYTAV
ncbi:MAG: hypothetical protein SV377_00225, partial [Halobacteria archaeon]|nr:hypothetical protein [Halobacteria archaeon]